MPANAVYVGRPTKWGNPYVVGHNYADGEHDEIPYDNIDAETAVRWYREAIVNGISTAVNLTVREIMTELRGKDLVCWCPLDQPCHADVLLEFANPTVHGAKADYIIIDDLREIDNGRE